SGLLVRRSSARHKANISPSTTRVNERERPVRILNSFQIGDINIRSPVLLGPAVIYTDAGAGRLPRSWTLFRNHPPVLGKQPLNVHDGFVSDILPVNSPIPTDQEYAVESTTVETPKPAEHG